MTKTCTNLSENIMEKPQHLTNTITSQGLQTSKDQQRVLAGAHERERAKSSPWEWGCLECLVSFPANCFRTSRPNSPENSCPGELNSWFYIKCLGWKNTFLLTKLLELCSQQMAHTYHIVTHYWIYLKWFLPRESIRNLHFNKKERNLLHSKLKHLWYIMPQKNFVFKSIIKGTSSGRSSYAHLLFFVKSTRGIKKVAWPVTTFGWSFLAQKSWCQRQDFHCSLVQELNSQCPRSRNDAKWLPRQA